MSYLKKILFHFSKHILNNIKSLKDSQKGKSCYIIGDGISIKWFDLSVFSNFPAFALNNIPYHNQANKLNIQYITYVQPFMFYKFKYSSKFIDNILKNFIKKNPNKLFFVNLSNYPLLWSKNIFYLFRNIPDKDSIFLNECESKNIRIDSNGFSWAVALAIYMGFKNIYLVGCDYTHAISRSRHWYEKGQGILKEPVNYQKEFLEISLKYANIVTITLEGNGTYVPGIEYEKFAGKTINYKENLELIQMKDLINIASCSPNYRIF